MSSIGQGQKARGRRTFAPCWQELIESNLLLANEELSLCPGPPSYWLLLSDAIATV